MSKVTVHAGDFEGEGIVVSKSLYIKSKATNKKESILFQQFETVDIASEDTVKKAGGTIGWGAVGALTLGPVGMLAGLLLGGKKKEVTFVATLKDGRKLMATTNNKSFVQLQAAVF